MIYKTGDIDMIRLLPRSPVVFGLFIGAAYFLFSRPKPSCAQVPNAEKSPLIPLIVVVGAFEEEDDHLIGIFDSALKSYNFTEIHKAEFKFVPIKIVHRDEFPAYTQICQELLTGVSLIVDVTWEGWVHSQSLASTMDIPYIRVDVTNSNFIAAMEMYLRRLEATNAAIVFPDETQLDQALNYLVGNTVVRIIVVDGSKDQSMNKLSTRRPTPTYLIFIGSTDEVDKLIDKALTLNMFHDESRSIVVQQDTRELNYDRIKGYISLVQPTETFCCAIDGIVVYNDRCHCGNEKIMYQERFMKTAVLCVADKFYEMLQAKAVVTGVIDKCDTISRPESTNRHSDFFNGIQPILSKRKVALKGLSLHWDSELILKYRNDSKFSQFSEYRPTSADLKDNANFGIELFKQKFFRIGSVWDVPFLFNKTDENGNTILKNGQPVKTGFCFDLMEKLKETMGFTYSLLIKDKAEMGVRMENGSWDGLMGDLIAGEIDIIIAPLVITSEREEVVDFVAPYFEQTGISIVMKKTEKQTSLFKFMSVLKDEVWWCILGALIVTSIVLWVVDKFSPYSGRNKKLYPYKCREFTLAECFWFSLTSMTPQGGGEPPKAVSGRILVAAYWIFVVLMLATFTANLAAFLTVERMQTPVSSLEELAKQSKINYTVVQGSTTFQFFNNMANAENELYRIWKDLTLNASGSDQARYRVWDYPIKEQYGRILNVIQMGERIETEHQGFKMANEKTDFAFIHDALRIKYEVYNNCNLTEVGEPFAEQPYAIAVQSGSHLQEEIGRRLLDFQKDRYFETLSQEYWNSSLRRKCSNDEEAEGITLDSIGGVFIMTLVGLVIGMITLIGEIIIYKRNKESKVVAIKVRQKKSMAGMK